MGKKFKDTKFGKILSSVAKGAIDILPGGSTIKDIAKNIAIKKFDRDGDGKLSLNDFKPAELVGLLGGLTLLAILASKGIIDVEILKQIAEILGF